jgi:LPXTG-site transpeptidase (sortase) family protein
MKTKIIQQRLVILTLLGCAIIVGAASTLAIRHHPKETAQEVKEAHVLPEEGKSAAALPVALKIPKINIDTKIEYVGMTNTGIMDSPKGPKEVGWYELGPRPGEAGSAVIDGHSGWRGNTPAAFDDLHALQKGDKIYVEDQTGTTTAFIVRESRVYKPSEDASKVFVSEDGAAHLNLITCAGEWNPLKKTHTDRLVVFADREA